MIYQFEGLFQILLLRLILHNMRKSRPSTRFFCFVSLPCLIEQLAVHSHLQLLLLFGQRHRRMVVQSLGHQLHRQRILLAAGLLDLGAFVLEPDLDLRLIQTQFCAQLLSPALVQVPVLVELSLRGRRDAFVNQIVSGGQ